MTPCLNRSQVEMLIKNRGDINNQQLYEMMKSRQVFQAQSGLIRDLKRAKKSLHHDERIMLANLHWQKTMFLKKVDAREKSLRYLVRVKINLEDIDPDTAECKDEQHDHNNIEKSGRVKVSEDRSKADGIELRSDYTLGDKFTDNRARRGDKNNDSFLTSNEEWMARVSERPGRMPPKTGSAKEKLTKKDSFSRFPKATDDMFPNCDSKAHHDELEGVHSHERKYPVIEGRELSATDAQLKGKKSHHLIGFRSLSSSSLKHRPPTQQSINGDYCHVKKPHQKSAPPNKHVRKRNPQVGVHKETEDMHKLLQKPNREKTVAMLFIEKEDRGKWPSVSLFDIDAWLEQYRQKRGHTVVLSTNFLHNGFDQPLVSRIHDEDEKLKKKPTSFRKPLQQRPLRFRSTSDRCENVRKRGKEWFTTLMADGKKHLHSRQDQSQMKDVKLLSDIHGKNTNLYGRKTVLPQIYNDSTSCKSNTQTSSEISL